MSFTADLRTVVRGRDFRRLFAARLTSQAADGTLQVALASLFFFSPERATSAGGVAAAFAVLLLPYSVVGPFAGVFLDRWRRRQVLVWSNVLRTAMVLGVAALVASGVDGVVLYAAVLACLSVNRFFLSALSAALPHVVPRHELVMANSVTTTSGTLCTVVGAGLGYLLGLLFGKGDASNAWTIVVAAAGYAVAALVARTMAPDLLGPDADPDRPATREALGQVAHGLVDGARHVVEQRPAAYALAAIGGHRFFYGVSTIAAILLFRNTFNDPGDVDAGLAGLAAVVLASGLGFFAAALATPPITARIGKSAWIVTCVTVTALVEYVFVAALSQAIVIVGSFVIGLAAQGMKICVDTVVQESIDDSFRGRVFSFYDVLFNVAFVSAAAFAALLLPSSGESRPIYALIATGYVVTALAYARAVRRPHELVPA